MVYRMLPPKRVVGPKRICTTATYTVSNLQPGDRVEWAVSKAIEIVSGQGTGTLAVRKKLAVGELGWIRASVSGQELSTFEVQVGTSTPFIEFLGSQSYHRPGLPCYATVYHYGVRKLPENGNYVEYKWHMKWLAEEPRSNDRALSLGLQSPRGLYEGYDFIGIMPWGAGRYSFSCTVHDQCGAGIPSYSWHQAYPCDLGGKGDFLDLQMYPNPAQGIVMVRLAEADDPAVDVQAAGGSTGRMVRIYSQHAELMYEGEITDGKQLDVRGWPRGAYTVMVDGRGVQTLVVE